ncbi:S8 family serine peptidase, partial [Candidatus Desantisbacteria bacterium]|nr:S8 family serine peptidase [Candidatus Desantisbacteria bacterium]
TQCAQLDQFVFEHKDFCIVVAAGNDGTDRDGDGRINPQSVSSPGTAKNCITVGACENKRLDFNSKTYGKWWAKDFPVEPIKNDPMADNPDQVVAFSSRGPAKNNRIKPDIVAPGTFILSTRSTMIAPNNMAWEAFPPSKMYFFMGGTSMATPLTSGAAAIVREYLRKYKKIKKPTAALLKAAMITGAKRLQGYAPDSSIFDIHQGYGRVNLDAILLPAKPVSAEFIEVKKGIKTGEVWSIEINIMSDDAPLRICIAYSDYPGSSLVNNLNLVLSSPDGKRYAGNQPEGAPLSMDTNNNVEVIHIKKPVIGKYRIDVIGSNIPKGPQDFALVYLGHIK